MAESKSLSLSYRAEGDIIQSGSNELNLPLSDSPAPPPPTDSLHRRGVRGWEEPVFDIKGNLCGYKPRYSDACLIFMLKSLKPEVFAKKPTTRIQNNVLKTKTDSEIVSEWRRRLGAGEGSAEAPE